MSECLYCPSSKYTNGTKYVLSTGWSPPLSLCRARVATSHFVAAQIRYPFPAETSCLALHRIPHFPFLCPFRSTMPYSRSNRLLFVATRYGAALRLHPLSVLAPRVRLQLFPQRGELWGDGMEPRLSGLELHRDLRNHRVRHRALQLLLLVLLRELGLLQIMDLLRGEPLRRSGSGAVGGGAILSDRRALNVLALILLLLEQLVLDLGNLCCAQLAGVRTVHCCRDGQ